MLIYVAVLAPCVVSQRDNCEATHIWRHECDSKCTSHMFCSSRPEGARPSRSSNTFDSIGRSVDILEEHIQLFHTLIDIITF